MNSVIRPMALEDKESVKTYAEILYFSARLIAGLSVEDQSGVTDKIIELLAK